MRHITESSNKISLILKGSEGDGKKGINFKYRLQRKVWDVKYKTKFVRTRAGEHVEVTLRFKTEPNRMSPNLISKSMGALTSHARS
jgi:GTP-sensing pleiotropic transcriptional regulator CodY